MSLLTISNLSIIRSGSLFSDVGFSVLKGDCIGLVAANGRGKSTLLRIIAGLEDATSGNVAFARGTLVAFAPQDPEPSLLEMSFYRAVQGGLKSEVADSESWRIDILLDDLEVPNEIRGSRVNQLSGGWQRVMLLARAAVSQPDILLLDEPTNHLDLGRIGILQRFLSEIQRDCAIIVASHDRAFLDAVTRRTLFLRPEGSIVFPLPYFRAVTALAEKDVAQGRKFENDKRKVKALRQQAAKLKNIGINSGSDLLVVKTKQLSERASKIEEGARPAHEERSAGLIRLSASDIHANALVTIDEGIFTLPNGTLLFRTPRLWINKHDRVAILGANGSGKSQLIKRLCAAVEHSDPKIRTAVNIKLGYSDQAFEQLSCFLTPWEAVKETSKIDDALARSHLAAAGISIDAQKAPLMLLSGGQKARLAMLLLRLSMPNLYVLDEPTNHLDIEGQEKLEKELIDQKTACLLVSHDRAFIRAVATRFWYVTGQKLVEVTDPEPVFQQLLGPT